MTFLKLFIEELKVSTMSEQDKINHNAKRLMKVFIQSRKKKKNTK
jgi:hypothetical protein